MPKGRAAAIPDRVDIAVDADPEVDPDMQLDPVVAVSEEVATPPTRRRSKSLLVSPSLFSGRRQAAPEDELARPLPPDTTCSPAAVSIECTFVQLVDLCASIYTVKSKNMFNWLIVRYLYMYIYLHSKKYVLLCSLR